MSSIIKLLSRYLCKVVYRYRENVCSISAILLSLIVCVVTSTPKHSITCINNSNPNKTGSVLSLCSRASTARFLSTSPRPRPLRFPDRRDAPRLSGCAELLTLWHIAEVIDGVSFRHHYPQRNIGVNLKGIHESWISRALSPSGNLVMLALCSSAP